MSPRQVVAQALGLALSIGLVCTLVVQVSAPSVLVRLAGEKSKEVRHHSFSKLVPSTLPCTTNHSTFVLFLSVTGCHRGMIPTSVFFVDPAPLTVTCGELDSPIAHIQRLKRAELSPNRAHGSHRAA